MSKNTKIFGGGLLASAIFFFLLIIASYWNHFDNGFYFDDSHTIVNNNSIRSLENIPAFFTDAATFSTLPNNQSYRPVVTTLNALDYYIGGGLNPVIFHISIFVSYLILCAFLFRFLQTTLDLTMRHQSNAIIALFSTFFYALHTANAETINYIISRSDSFSTLCVLFALVMYQNLKARKYFLYMIPAVVGLYTKQTAVMVIPILFVYVFLFENAGMSPRRKFWGIAKGVFLTFRKLVLPALILMSLAGINQLFLTQKEAMSSVANLSTWSYFITQFYVILHYLGNFIIPINLSADPDFQLLDTVADYRFVSGVIMVGILLGIAVKTARIPKLRLISFGILWFFLALIPTSSVIPLYQIANDHRTFFPYIGLVIATAGFIRWIVVSNFAFFSRQIPNIVTYVCCTLFLLFHAYGVHGRNEVWGSAETLWKDVTIKSPANGRGLMNYGLTQMKKGELQRAEEYFIQAMAYIPQYSYLHINLGVLSNRQGKKQLAEDYFRNAMRYDSNNPEAWYFYGEWLHDQNRIRESETMVKKSLEISPGHIKANKLLREIGLSESGKLNHLLELISKQPSPEIFLELSLHYYNTGEFSACIEACNSALKLNPNYAHAYNNMCSAYNMLKNWEQAKAACRKALEIEPEFERARNNLKWADDNSR